MRIKILLVIVSLLFAVMFAIAGYVQASPNTGDQPPLVIQILSGQTLNGTAGDYVTVAAQIQNISSRAVNDVTTYLSLADEETKLPVDLEDWNAEKGLFIGTIEAGQILPLDWKIHFVKSGKYSLIVIAEIAGENYPQVSSITHFVVSPKHNLNPGQVLPVALGTPAVLLIIIMLATYKRNSKLT